MKILLISYHNPHFHTITEYIENAIRVLGHELNIFDDRQHILPGRIRKRFPLLNELDLNHLNKKLISAAIDKKPDLAIIVGGHRITSKTVNILKRNNIYTVLWTIDPPMNFQPILDAAPFYDQIFCQGTEAIELLVIAGTLNAHWLPVGCDPEIHRPLDLSNSEKQSHGHDVVFVGSYYPNRAHLFAGLADFDLAIYGPNWHHLTSGSPLRNRVRSANIKPENWIKIYNSSKIILAPHYKPECNSFPVYQASPRVFEALASKSLVITDRQKDVLALFKDGRHLVTFENSEDLKAKIEYYLTHTGQRKKIAEQGYEEVLHKHTFVHRINTMLSTINYGN